MRQWFVWVGLTALVPMLATKVLPDIAKKST